MRHPKFSLDASALKSLTKRSAGGACPSHEAKRFLPTTSPYSLEGCGNVSEDSHEETLLKELLKIEKHEDRMITAMVHLTASNEKLNERLTALTWVMLALTWITFVISVPNTLATIFGIPKVNEMLGLGVMVAALVISTATALVLVIMPGSTLSLSSMRKRMKSGPRRRQ